MLSNDPYTLPNVSRRGTRIKGGVSSCDFRGGGPKDVFFWGGRGPKNVFWGGGGPKDFFGGAL